MSTNVDGFVVAITTGKSRKVAQRWSDVVLQPCRRQPKSIHCKDTRVTSSPSQLSIFINSTSCLSM